MKRWLLSALTSAPVARALRPLRRDSVPIFMQHRFGFAERPSGHDVPALRRRLDAMRRDGARFVPLQTVVSCVRDGEPLPERAVAFTVDDGYADFIDSGAAAAYAEFDCPVTMFVATGFIDGTCWYWWDRIEWAFTRSRHARIDAQLGAVHASYAWATPAAARAAAHHLSVRLEHVTEEEKQTAMARLAAVLDVEIPRRAPDEFAPMTWEQIRSFAARDVTFGPHTVTHPILSQTTDAQSEFEITESWRRLSAEVAAAVPVFCYPNGSDFAVTGREVATVRRIGLAAALTTFHGYIDRHGGGAAGADAPYLMHRVGYPDDELDYRRVVSGFDRAELALRRARRVRARSEAATPS
jgi:peptidoglycan/xylan/chitin deacetylase (PgdA/CDA1 family)